MQADRIRHLVTCEIGNNELTLPTGERRGSRVMPQRTRCPPAPWVLDPERQPRSHLVPTPRPA